MDRVRTLSAPALISRLGIPLVQQKALKKLGIKSMDDFLSFEDEGYVIGKNIIAWKALESNRIFLEDLMTVVEVEDAVSGESLGQVCMTGKGPMGRKDLQKLIEERGYEFSSSVTKSTKILLCEDPEGGSSKLQKARKNGILLMSYQEFLEG
jgi:NAD-dependent DNA ligase